MTLLQRLSDLRRGDSPQPDGRWVREVRSLRHERYVGGGSGYVDDEVILRPVDRLGCRYWEVVTSTIDGDEEAIAGPVPYREAVDAAEEYMTSLAWSASPDDVGVRPDVAH